jgi:curved DNA-binding protein CbpA
MADGDARTHYQVLGIAPTASADEVRRAHRQLAHLLHPDRLALATAAERSLGDRRMREVNAAWTVLSDPTRRADYDRSLRAARTGPTPPPRATPPNPTSRPGTGAGSSRPEDSDDPDAAFERLRRAEADEDDDELLPGHLWLLRRGPVVAALAIAVVLFVLTAYAGSGGGGAAGGDGPDSSRAPAIDESGGCVRFLSGGDRSAYTVSCAGPNDGRIVGRVIQAMDCRTDGGYASIGGRYVCLERDAG